MDTKSEGKETRRKRVVFYMRVGCIGDENLIALEAQKAALEEELGKHPDWVLSGVYSDAGPADGEARHSQVLRQMLKAAEAGEFDRVLTSGVSRLSRSMPHLLEIVRFLQSQGVEIQFIREGISTDNREFGEGIKWRERLGL